DTSVCKGFRSRPYTNLNKFFQIHRIKKLQKLRKIMIKSINHQLRLSAIIMFLRNSYVVTMQPVSAMCDWQVWAYLQICSLHELLFFFLKLQPDGFFSH
ncbi:unnamed protein product, partial [Brassica rapa subsp. trilocularis]